VSGRTIRRRVPGVLECGHLCRRFPPHGYGHAPAQIFPEAANLEDSGGILGLVAGCSHGVPKIFSDAANLADSGAVRNYSMGPPGAAARSYR